MLILQNPRLWVIGCPNLLQGETNVSVQRHVLHVAYYESLLATRQFLLERSGYRVSSALGNDAAKAQFLAADDVDLVVMGFSGAYGARAELLGWLKRHHPRVPVVVLQAHTSEKFPEADGVALSESPETWLAAVAECIKKQLGC